jgi:recombination protein RecA
MFTASTIRLKIESALAQKIPSALTPAPRMIRPVAETGVEELDEVIQGGLPVGAVSELVGPECSGRTSLALSFVARSTQAAKVCAWIDVSNAFDPISAAAAGVDLARLLWVRCGALPNSGEPASHSFALPEKYLVPPAAKEGLHSGGFGPHPRTESKGLSDAVTGLLRPEALAPRCAEPQSRVRPKAQIFEPRYEHSATKSVQPSRPGKPWPRIEQGLRATDLLLQGGGFSAIVLDMGGLPAEAVSRVPLATWFRYRAAAERTQSSIVLLTQYACTKSSAELLLRLEPGEALRGEATVFTGIEHRVEVLRRRFAEAANNVVPMRKPPQWANVARWHSRTVWAGAR